MTPRGPQKPPKLKEIEPGEIRTVCWICETPVRSRENFCARHKSTSKSKTCERCGGDTYGTICRPCRHDTERSNTQCFLGEADRERVEELWAKGATGPEIAADLGLTNKHPLHAIILRRKRGWNLPLRNPTAAANAARMRKRKRQKELALR